MGRRGLMMIALMATAATPVWAQGPSSYSYGPNLAAGESPAAPSTAAPFKGVSLAPPGKPGFSCDPHDAATTLNGAFCEVYLTNPTLLGERAKLRAADEGVPAALSGWRPQVSYQVEPGWGYGTITNRGNAFSDSGVATGTADVTKANSRWTFSQQVQIAQPIFRGGRTVAATAQAENQVRAERGRLLAQEEQSFADGASAYISVVADQRLYDLQVDNVEVLSKQLDATNQRFKLGEVDRTDVAQAQAALAGAVSARDTAYATLQTARGTYRQVIGTLPEKLTDPQPLVLPVHTLEDANTLAATNNAAVIAAAFDDAAAKDAVDAAYAALMPEGSLQVTGEYANQPTIRGTIFRGGTVAGEVTVPIYQGGAEYAAIRQAKQNEQQTRRQLEAARRAAVLQASQFWSNYVAARDAVAAVRVEIRADEIALDGVERQALAGTETTQNVLYAEQQLVTARETLVQDLDAMVNNSYSLAAAIGRLSARDLSLHVPLYDETAYYKDVRLLPWGISDQATDQPGR